MPPKEDRGQFPVGHVARSGEKRGSGWVKCLLILRGIIQWFANSIYTVGGYRYETDAFRRVCKVSGSLRFGVVDRHTSQQSMVGKLAYRYGDAGGHLIACQFGGSGHAINMVPMNAYLNQLGAWRQMENNFRRLLLAGNQVFITIFVHYEGTSLRPSGFDVVCNVRSCSGVLTNTRYTITNPRP